MIAEIENPKITFGKIGVMKEPRTLNELRNDPRVKSLGDERDTGDGVWVYLAPGWWNLTDECSVVHRDCWKDAMRAMGDVIMQNVGDHQQPPASGEEAA